MVSSKRISSISKTALALVASALFLCSCASTGGGEEGQNDGFLGMGESTHEAENHSWIVDGQPSQALDPSNWMDYAAYYLGEVLLAPVRVIGIILDGA